jgi:histidinol-phosphate aminotransferase
VSFSRADLHPGELAVPAVRSITPYVPGKPISELEREFGLHDVAKLASNENPWGPSVRAIGAMQQAVADIWLYPDGSGHELRHALARHLQVDAGCITLGNGSNDLLVLLAEAFLSPAHNAVYSQYAFSIYSLVIQATGAEARAAPALPPDHVMPLGHDLDAMAARADGRTRLIFIAYPNNPTGTWLDPVALHRFIGQTHPGSIVVLDEAYFEYAAEAGTDGVAWLGEFPRLVVLRTFSKAYGLAGARVGYAVSHPEVADVLNRLRAPFNVNAVALAGAAAALADAPHMQRCVAATHAELGPLRRALETLGLKSIPSAANFLLVNFGANAAQVYDLLLRCGVIVRPVGAYGLPDYLRISVGTPAQNQRLLQALGAMQRGAP